MEVYQEIIDDIRTVLSSDVPPPAETLEQLVDRYVQAIRVVNGRLREADALLQKGHRAEAIQKCENEPSLLESVALLDFPERGGWMEMVRQYGLPSPLELLIEVAADLNEAYAQEAPLAKLMRQHRLHALSRSPLPVRIKVLRTIFARDPGNPLWQEDLREYEKRRHSHLPSEVSTAVAQEDFRALSRLEEEVTSDRWILQPDQALINRVVAAHTELRVAHARAELEQLVLQLSGAHAEFEVELGRRLRKRWKACAVIGIEHDNDPLLERAGPALEWLEEQDREDREEAEYNTAVAELEHAMDDSTPRENLEKLHHAVVRFDRGIPELLQSRVGERIRYLDVAATRRSRMIFAAAVLFLLASAGGIGWLIFQHMQSTNLAEHVANVEKMLEDGKLLEARKYLAELETAAPQIFNSPDIQRVVGDLEAAERIEEERVAARAKHLDVACSLGLGEETPWENFSPALKEVEDAKELSIGAAELAECMSLKRQIEGAKNDKQEQVDKAFVEQLTAFREGCGAVDPNNLDQLERLIDEGEVLYRALRVSSVLKQQVDPLRTYLADKRKSYMDAKGEVAFLETITNALGSRSRFEERLREYAEKYPNRLRSRDFLSVRDNEKKLWEGLDQWNGFLQHWSRRDDFNKLSVESAEAFITEAEALIHDHPGFPAETKVQEVIAYLQPLTQRVDEQGNRIHLFLDDVLSQAWIRDLKMVTWKREKDAPRKRYYFDKDPIPVSIGDSVRSYTFHYYNSVALQDLEKITIPLDEIAAEHMKADGGFDWKSPQARFSDKARLHLSGLPANWEETFYLILWDLAEERDMEAGLKLVLLQQFLHVARQGSQPFDKVCQRMADRVDVTVDRLAPEQANWLDPDDVEGGRIRAAAQSALSELQFTSANIKALGWKIENECNSMAKPDFGPRYDWIGWLYRDLQGNWTCPTVAGQGQTVADLFVLHGSAESGVSFEKVATIQNSKVTLDDSSAAVLVEGRPVYLMAK